VAVDGAVRATSASSASRFLAASEANTDDEYRARPIDASESDTIYSTLFDGGWPNAPHRALVNSTVRAWQEADRPDPPDRPREGEVIARAPDGRDPVRYGDDIPVRGTTGDLEALAHYAGQSVGLTRGVRPASEIASELVTEAVKALSCALSNTPRRT
jgi:NAD(P)H-dependent flavin oxidoreductase YrpB (nitropropane dioxygenase family)